MLSDEEAQELALSGGLGALLGIDDQALLAFVSAAYMFAAGLDEELALEAARLFIANYREFAKSEGIANA